MHHRGKREPSHTERTSFPPTEGECSEFGYCRIRRGPRQQGRIDHVRLVRRRGRACHPRRAAPVRTARRTPNGRGRVPSSSSSSRRPRRGPSQVIWGAATSLSPASGTSVTCPTRPRRFPPSTRDSPGPASVWTSMVTSSRCMSSTPTRRLTSRSSRSSWRRRTNSCSPRTRTVRVRPSPGICVRNSNPRSRSAAWCSTRSPKKPSNARPTTPVT